jgi:MoxR-like ATPase
MKINHTELKQQLKIAYETKIPLFIWGTTGIGKSDSVKSMAMEIAKDEKLDFSDTDVENGKFGFIDVRISQLEPSDLRGLPSVEKDRTKWLTPSWLPKNPNSKGILFFDEINLSPPSIQASCYQLILDRKLGDYKLPNGWVIVSAGNRVEDKCNVFEMSSALCNRFTHSELMIPDKDSWLKWALDNGIDNRIIAFLQFKPSSLFNFDSKNKDKSFPTPRSWAMCSKLIKELDDKNIVEILVSSAVGEATTLEFMAFLRLQNQIDIKELMNNPKLVANITEIDLKYVLLGTIAEYYRKDKTLLEKSFELCDYLEAEFSILLLRFLKGVNKTHFSKTIMENPKGNDLLNKYADILN